MPGSLLTGNEAGRWSRLAAAAQVRALVGCAAVGVIAGLLAAHVRLHAGLPGHKALFWMAPVLAARLLYGHPAGATAGACAAALTSLAFGGNLAGGALYVPLVALAGGLLDAAAAWAGRRTLPAWLLVAFFGAAGAAGNLLCAVKRMLVPQRAPHELLGLAGPLAQVLSYALFGLLAGLIGATVATSAARIRRPRARS